MTNYETLGVGQRFFLYLDSLGNKIFTPKYNPLYHLGGISTLLMGFLFINGIYLFLYYRIGAENAWTSLDYISNQQWWLAGVMRSTHRYAADGLIISVVLHIFREYFLQRFRAFKKLGWLTGWAMLLILWDVGITGYLMVWDERAQIIALLITKLLSSIPVFEALPTSFLKNSSLTNMLFLIITFCHVFLPIFTGFFLFVHQAGITRSHLIPPKQTSYTIGALLIIYSFIFPALSAAPGDLARIPTKVDVDWFYLSFFPYLDLVSPTVAWLTLFISGILFIIVPMLFFKKQTEIIELDLSKCVGCKLCYEDCPYGAIEMRKRTDGKKFEYEASVVDTKCANCGICVGSCETLALSLDHVPNSEIINKITSLMSSTTLKKGEPKILGFVCNFSIRDYNVPNIPNFQAIRIPCVGTVHSTFLSHAFKSGADGVMIIGCKMGDCYYRDGNKWLEMRLSGEREPSLRKTLDLKRINTTWLSPVETKAFHENVQAFSANLKTAAPMSAGGGKISPIESKKPVAAVTAICLAIPLLLVSFFSDIPFSFYPPDISMIKISYKYASPRLDDCSKQELSTYKEQRSGLRPHMQQRLRRDPTDCGKRTRSPMKLVLIVDGIEYLSKTFHPGGVSSDLSIFVYDELMVPSGPHKVALKMKDLKGNSDQFDYEFEEETILEPAKVYVYSFHKSEKVFFRDTESRKEPEEPAATDS